MALFLLYPIYNFSNLYALVAKLRSYLPLSLIAFRLLKAMLFLKNSFTRVVYNESAGYNETKVTNCSLISL